MNIDWTGPLTEGDHRIVSIEGSDLTGWRRLTCRMCGVVHDGSGIPEGHDWHTVGRTLRELRAEPS